ncbi:MAG TPA: hypothetical protein VIU62_22470, partial [Chloroflexota bacterium]
TLQANSSTDSTDKPFITVDKNPASPHYGRVAVTWTDFPNAGGLLLWNAYSDNGGASWSRGATSINFPSSNCGNGTSPAFDANGELMVAWWECTPSLEEELSSDGGATWPAPSDTVITGINNIGTPSSPCSLNAGGTAFRCNSFPALAGDPNTADEGGQAFEVVWANLDAGITDSRFPNVSASISEIHGLSTSNGGAGWNHSAYMNSANFGDKFFPAIAFAQNGRMDVAFSDREDNASASNPNGNSFDEHGTEADSLASLFADSYITFTDDGTLASPGSSGFIGDYAGLSNMDANFDAFPVWTDVRGGFNNVRTMDLCYTDCYTFLAPYTPRSAGSTSAFVDLYQYNTDTAFGGSGFDYWNAVGIREGADGTVVDDDTILYGSRYFNTQVAYSDESPPLNDYILENDNSGHGPTGPYFQQVHSFNAGPYSIEWAAGHIIVSPGAYSDSVLTSSVIRVYDSFLNTGTTYSFGLRPAAGNTSKLSLTLHSASNGNQQGRFSAVADSGAGTVGQPAFISANTGANPGQYDGVVVINNNGGSGSYTIYEDTAAPTGTININGGASTTSSTSVTLDLTASNPTAGDPVLDMRFSNDGVTFGAWQPFSATAAYTLPSGNGVKTVYAQFRNGAGVVSATVSHSITLVSASTGNPYNPVAPARLLDTRTGLGGYSTPFGAGTARAVQVTGLGGVPSTGVSAVVLNVTVTDTSASSYLTVYPSCAGSPPNASNLNWIAGKTIANRVMVPVGSDGKVC